MEYNEFLEEIQDKIAKAFDEKINIKIEKIVKNNGVKLDGLSIRSENETISPTIYLNDYYDEFVQGCPMDRIVNHICSIYYESKGRVNFDIDKFSDYDQIRESIMFKLINYDKNEELLKSVPHVEFLDLAIVFYCHISFDEFENASILIRNNHMENWNVDCDKLYEDAYKNTRNILGCEIRSMKDVLLGLSCNDEAIDEALSVMEDPGMYVLGNRNGTFGAAGMIYKDKIREFALEKQENLYILPSSVHELIIVPEGNVNDPLSLKDMVKDVNATMLKTQEILSDNVYVYKLDENSLECL